VPVPAKYKTVSLSPPIAKQSTQKLDAAATSSSQI
jgi:hypothetical protein